MRIGAKGKPFYRLVVKEKRSKRDGAYIENVGTYDPMIDPAEVNLKHDRIQYWIGVGAKPTETVASLIKNNPVQTDEEREATLKARAEKKVAVEAEKLAAKKAETERLAAEKAETEKAEAEAAKAAAAEAESAEEAAVVEETPAEEAPVAEETPAEEAAAAE
ncbi:MAG: 30S ribosomal protein S16 [Pyrinomonadaceae bacterium]